MHASKFVTYVVVGLVANLTRLAISALPGGQLDYLLDQFFAIVHTAWVDCKKKEEHLIHATHHVILYANGEKYGVNQSQRHS